MRKWFYGFVMSRVNALSGFAIGPAVLEIMVGVRNAC